MQPIWAPVAGGEPGTRRGTEWPQARVLLGGTTYSGALLVSVSADAASTVVEPSAEVWLGLSPQPIGARHGEVGTVTFQRSGADRANR